jgi:hypothetical protein
MKINRVMELHHGARQDAAQALFGHETFKEFLIFFDSAHLLFAKCARLLWSAKKYSSAPEGRPAVPGPQARPAQRRPVLPEAVPPD